MSAVRAMGDRALLLELDDMSLVLPTRQWLRDQDLDGVVDLVAGARTVLVRTTPDADLGRLRRALLAAAPDEVRPPPTRDLEIPVTYDGPDLEDVARHLGSDVHEVVAAHVRQTWSFAFAGFAPGFAYLRGDADWHIPRRATPRTRVPPGSVALASGWCGIYPTSSPGGWQLLGTTDTTLFDLDRDPPNLLRPGDRVRFVST